jgi:hypothetical protein
VHRVNDHYEGDGEVVFQHACKLGCEGIVSLSYRSGRSPDWVKVKNPEAPAVIGIMIAALLVHFLHDGSPLPAAADRLNHAARGGDIDKAVIAM